MGVTLAELGLEKLPPDDAAQQLLTDEERVELEHRIAAADADPNDAIPWETIREEARARWKR